MTTLTNKAVQRLTFDFLTSQANPVIRDRRKAYARLLLDSFNAPKVAGLLDDQLADFVVGLAGYFEDEQTADDYMWGVRSDG